ncbi:MAG: glycosyltransferase family 2 protein [Anaeromyxobacteraceae bacterium]
MLVAALDVALTLAALPVTLASGYLLVLTLLSFGQRPKRGRAPHLRFDIVVPAHDEEEGIAATVGSLKEVHYPASLRRILVVADNCSDATAARARDAGATVLVRTDPDRRGKGYALAFAFERVLAEDPPDAVVVVDADCLVTPNVLAAFAARLDEGALAVQCAYVIGNPRASWRTSLMAIGFALVNVARPRGRERLGLSAGLHGTGMCFAASVLREVPHDAFSIVEDLEYGLRLGLAGHRVHFAPEASVQADALATVRGSGPQRLRWEDGRRAVARAYVRTLLRRAMAARDPVLFDLGLDLLVPPLAKLGQVAVAGAAATAIGSVLAEHSLWATWPWGFSLAALCLHVAAGWWLSGTGVRGLASLLHAPAYLAWKAVISSAPREHPSGSWVRTRRGRPL